MYTEADELTCQGQLKKNLWISLGIAVVTLALIVAGVILRYKWASVAVSALGFSLAYFVWSMKGLPWYRYRRFLRDIREGLSRVTVGRFVSVSEEEREREGVMFREFLLEVDEEGEEDERLFYWDAGKQLPQLRAGQRLTLTSFGNYIIALAEG